jgi:hypothetical protein
MLLPLRAEQVPGLDDDDLGFEADRRLALLPPRLAEFVRAVFAGESQKATAERLGYQHVPSLKAGAPRLALALLREQARRQATLTAAGAIARFQHLSRRAEDAGDLGVAVAADREAAKIAALYPEPAAGPAGVSPVMVSVQLQLPQRITPPSFLVQAERPALPPSEPAPAPVEIDPDDPLLR